jgi:uncharacterized protein YbcV (DUF1398 family)
MNTKEIHEVMKATQAGMLTFPNVVRRFLEAGVESYFVDFATARETVYGVSGETLTESVALAIGPVAVSFSEDRIVAAIRAAQADTIRYPEFVKLAAEAGVIGYWAYLTGRKVVYFGRKGESHTEMFPGSKE